MRLGLRMVISVLRQGWTPLVLTAIVAVGSICMLGCIPVPSLGSSYSEIVPGTVPVDTFLIDDTYKAVKIGGVTWMAENLNIENGNFWCLNDEEAACAMLGRLYDWNTAMNICPPGWHLPSRQEWVDLEAMAGGDKVAGKRLRSKQFGGTDDYGFGARPAGVRTYIEGSVRYIGCIDKTMLDCDHGWWTSSVCDRNEECSDMVYMAWLGQKESNINFTSAKRTGLSVRCILNE